MAENVTNPEDMAALLEGRSDAEIEEYVQSHGVDAILQRIFEEMAQRFLPDRAQGRNATIQYDLSTADGAVHTWQVLVEGGSCAVRQGSDQPATVTLALSVPNFLRLITGKLNGVQAFMSGALKLRGDMMLAQTMQGWFVQTT